MASEGCKSDRGEDRTEPEIPERPQEPENGAGERRREVGTRRIPPGPTAAP